MSRLKNLKLTFSLLPLAAGFAIAASLGQVPAIAQVNTVQSGYDYLERGWINDAIREFQQAVRQQPQSVEAQLGLAIAYQRAGQDAEAWQAYKQVLALAPQNRRALAAVGTLGSYRPDWQRQGIDALTTLLDLEPLNTEARAQRALLLGYQGRFAAAIADYEILLANNPAPQTVMEAAQIQTYSGNYRQGLMLFEQYRQTGESLTDAAAIAYAQTLSEANRSNEAIALLNRRLEASPDAVALRAALATAYASDNQTDQALTVLAPLRNTAAGTLPLARALSRIGRQRQDSALYQEAIALYRQALAATTHPSEGFLIEVADVLSEDPAHWAAALELYDQVLARSPAQPATQTKRLILAYQLGEISRTTLSAELSTLLQPLPTDAATQQQIGQALIRLDDPTLALLPIYSDLISAETPVDFIYFRFAQIQMAREDWTAAREAIATYQATSSGSRDLAPALLLAEIERRQGNLDASAQQYEAIFSQADSLAIQESALLGLSGVRQSQQQWERALIAYERLMHLNPHSDRAQLGVAYLALKLDQMTLEQAERVLDTWVANYPTLPAAMVPPELPDLVGELPPAVSRSGLYETLLAIAPTHLGLNRRYAQTLALTDPEAAMSYLAAIAPADPSETSVYFVQGEVAQTLGEFDLASQAYETILVHEPHNADALAALAGVRFQQGRFAAAESLYEEVLALRPNDWETRRILAEVHLAQDEAIAAMAAFAALAADPAAQPTDPSLEYRLQETRLNFLRRRGFQPHWEQY